jgi:hypothetical protein
VDRLDHQLLRSFQLSEDQTQRSQVGQYAAVPVMRIPES